MQSLKSNGNKCPTRIKRLRINKCVSANLIFTIKKGNYSTVQNYVTFINELITEAN